MKPESSQVPTGHEYDQFEANEALLRNSELGIILTDAYIAAVNHDARLNDIAIVPIEAEGEHKHAFARPTWNTQNQSGRHEIHVRLDDLDGTLAMYEDTMRQTPENTAIIARSLGIPPSEVTPQLLFVQSILHEMGHTLEYMDYEAGGKTPEDHKHDQRVERSKLPIGGLLVSQLLSENHPNKVSVEENWDAASQTASERYGDYRNEDIHIHTMQELIDATSDVYRHSRFESAADTFAADVLQWQPVMMTQLTGDITRFRNYPQNAQLQPAA